MARIKVKQPDNVQSNQDINESFKTTIAQFCYYYPQYTFEQAMDLPIRLVRRMLRIVRREQAMNYLELVQIARVAQYEKPGPFDELAERYQREAHNG